MTTVPSSIAMPEPSTAASTTPRPVAEEYSMVPALTVATLRSPAVTDRSVRSGDPGDVVGGVGRRTGRVHDVGEHQPHHHVDRRVELPVVDHQRVGAHPARTVSVAASTSASLRRRQQGQQLGLRAVRRRDDRLQQGVGPARARARRARPRGSRRPGPRGAGRTRRRRRSGTWRARPAPSPRPAAAWSRPRCRPSAARPRPGRRASPMVTLGPPALEGQRGRRRDDPLVRGRGVGGGEVTRPV